MVEGRDDEERGLMTVSVFRRLLTYIPLAPMRDVFYLASRRQSSCFSSRVVALILSLGLAAC